MFNGVEKVPKKLLLKIESLDCDFTFKNNLKELLNYIAKSNIYNSSFLGNFDLYFGNSYRTENLIFHLEINRKDICIYDENNMGERCELFFEFVDNAQELEYASDENNRLFSVIADFSKTQVLIDALKRMSNDKNLLLKYNVKKLITRRERINLKIEEILSRRITS